MKRNREGTVFLTAMGAKNLTLEFIGREQVAPGFPRLRLIVDALTFNGI